MQVCAFISSHIDFKVILLIYKCLNSFGPLYLSEPLLPHKPLRTLRSSVSMSEASFQIYRPHLLNSLLEDLRVAESMEGYKRKYTTYLFSLTFNLSLLLSDILAHFSMYYMFWFYFGKLRSSLHFNTKRWWMIPSFSTMNMV